MEFGDRNRGLLAAFLVLGAFAPPQCRLTPCSASA
jgi:hypothetical protein